MRTSPKAKYKKAAKINRALVSPKNLAVSGANRASNGSHSTQASPMSLSLLATAISLSLMAPSTPIQAADINVNGACSLANAITSANTNSAVGGCDTGAGEDTLILEAGSSHTLSNTYAVDGDNRLPSVTSTITIEGNGASLMSAGGSASRLIHVAYGGDLSLNDISLSGGIASSTAYGSRGGAIFNRGQLTFNRSILSGNAATQEGGALHNQAGTVTLNNSTISNNSVSNFGGGLSNHSGHITLNESQISDNTAIGASSKGGGLFAHYGGTLDIQQSTVSDNTAKQGGGVGLGASSASINHSTLSNNLASHPSVNGGGALFSFDGSTVDIQNSTLSANTALEWGGGIMNDASNADISNSTVSGNSANRAGAILNTGNASMSLLNSTVSNNTATVNIGGIHTLSSDLRIQYSLLANSFVGALPGADCDNSASTISTDNFSLIEDQGNCNTIALSGDPLLGPLQDNGGPTQTHALLEGSLAIDNARSCSNAPINNRDQRGEFRPNGANCDIGAFEFEPAGVVITVDTVTACDSLINAISAANSNTAIGGCPAGNGHDTIVLQNASLHELNVVNNTHVGDNGLPLITSKITIEGNGATVTRNIAALPFRLFFVRNARYNGQLTLNNLTVSNGSATGVGQANGGGGIFSQGVLTLNNSTITGNTAVSFAGGIFAYGGFEGGSLRLNNSSVSNNYAPSGGGLYLSRVNAGITHSRIHNNVGRQNGGGIGIGDSSEVTIDSSTLSANTSQGGGAIWSHGDFPADSKLTINNSTLSGNVAQTNLSRTVNSAAMTIRNTRVTLNNSTVTNNQALNPGYDPSYNRLAITAGEGSPFTINNSVLANPGDDCYGVSVPVASNWFDDISCSGTENGDPLLGPLADNGGPTKTHEPLQNSPLIDKGDNALCSAAPINNLDQRGETRPDGAQCDIGAVEAMPPRGSFFVIPVSGGKSVIFSL